MDKKQKNALLRLTALLMLVPSMIIVPAMATSPSDTSVGDRYAVITIKGEAKTKIQGQLITAPPSVELLVEVRETYQEWVLFKVNCGEIEVDGVTYQVVSGWWRGSYNRATHVGIYEGWARDGNGNNVYFILRTLDLRQTQEGCFMGIGGTFRDPNGNYWSLNLLTYRFEVD
ncbi:MAG: hypothetical protein HXX80_03010 [Nitrososphaerales archaeon]|nr:hypothetical protein [Nitrososphaerales archaeon]